ncbi:MAG: hypothetical protein ACJAYJ_003214 [Saprospiraceae bacterium]|jgi:hypothetical protein
MLPGKIENSKPQPRQVTQHKQLKNAYDITRYIKIAKDKFGIEIEKIYLGHNKTGLTAVIVNITKKKKESELSVLQDNLNKVFKEYKSAKLYTIVNYEQRPFALIMANKDSYEKEKNWISVYKYDFAIKKLKAQSELFTSKLSSFKKLENHEIISIYYGLEWIGLPRDKSKFPNSLVCFTKDENDNYFRFKVYGEKISKLWSYRFDENTNRFYSTGLREDHQVNFVLPNDDMVNVNLYYFDENDERYGSYYLKVK